MFDSTTIELNGVPFDASSFDLEFEKVGIAAFSKSGTVELDRTTAHTGLQSLRIASESLDLEALSPPEQMEAILAEMQTSREEWLTMLPAEEVERALLNARIVVQYLRMRVGGPDGSRDAAMADNVAWLTEQHPEERLILWAHNAHISRWDGMMGSYLTEQFGDSYLPIGFATASGEYTAIGNYGLSTHELQKPPTESFEAHFAAAGDPIFALDLRGREGEDAGFEWLNEVRPFRLVGAAAMDEQFLPTPLRDHYDLIIFVKETMSARQL